jgi:hypothetical protein
MIAVRIPDRRSTVTTLPIQIAAFGRLRPGVEDGSEAHPWEASRVTASTHCPHVLPHFLGDFALVLRCYASLLCY